MIERRLLIVLFLVAFACPAPGGPPPDGAKGLLFIIGGGDRPEAMMGRFAQLVRVAGSGRVLVLPNASAEPQTSGPEMAAELRGLGLAAEPLLLSREEADRPESLKALEGTIGVYFTGGVQSRITAALRGTAFHRGLLALYERGGVIGGTSAGAAIMSEVMITGDERRPVEDGRAFETIEAGNVVTAPGLGFLKEAVIDQHFATRKRHNRLISVVAERPGLVGVGVDESTAAVIHAGGLLEVVGEKSVIVMDAGRARIRVEPSGGIGIEGLVLHVLRPGDLFDLGTRKAVAR
ncbi:MAG: cyanophycinase [Candidatus Aminicenantes bacterium]|nr:cyanophycinase [Candidatus Aminicenantes bacterium]